MATPKMALNECDIPLHAVIDIDASGAVLGRSHRFIFDQGTIQFVNASPLPLLATFNPLGVFGDAETGQVEIPANGHTARLSPEEENVCVNFQVTGESIAPSTMFSVTVGCAPLSVVVDAAGNLSIENSCIPNGGAITFIGAEDIPSTGIQISFTTSQPGLSSPFGPPFTLLANAEHSLHAIHTDVTVTVVTSDNPREGSGGTVKIGSGGGGPMPPTH